MKRIFVFDKENLRTSFVIGNWNDRRGYVTTAYVDKERFNHELKEYFTIYIDKEEEDKRCPDKFLEYIQKNVCIEQSLLQDITILVNLCITHASAIVGSINMVKTLVTGF
jgi:hypothetical protein